MQDTVRGEQQRRACEFELTPAVGELRFPAVAISQRRVHAPARCRRRRHQHTLQLLSSLPTHLVTKIDKGARATIAIPTQLRQAFGPFLL